MAVVGSADVLDDSVEMDWIGLDWGGQQESSRGSDRAPVNAGQEHWKAQVSWGVGVGQGASSRRASGASGRGQKSGAREIVGLAARPGRWFGAGKRGVER